MTEETVDCRVLRCSRQDEMYIYLRQDLQPQDIPEALRQRAGQLTEVMQLQLSAQRRLARVNVLDVIAQLKQQGYFLQMPPSEKLNNHLHFGD